MHYIYAVNNKERGRRGAVVQLPVLACPDCKLNGCGFHKKNLFSFLIKFHHPRRNVSKIDQCVKNELS